MLHCQGCWSRLLEPVQQGRGSSFRGSRTKVEGPESRVESQVSRTILVSTVNLAFRFKSLQLRVKGLGPRVGIGTSCEASIEARMIQDERGGSRTWGLETRKLRVEGQRCRIKILRSEELTRRP
eukprot:1118023-Rhodomonas_salina.3